MPAVTVSAIVLRSINYRDNDRMLTLLTPNQGRVEVMSRGCRRPKSPFMSASEVFCTGEYVLFSQHDKNILTSCTLHDSFYPLRLDYGLLSCGAYLLNLCEAAAQPEEESGPLFWLLLKSLHRMAYGQEDCRGLVSGFLLHYAAVLGYKPRLYHCVHCGRKLEKEEPVVFDCEAGGLACHNCPNKKSSLLINQKQAVWLQTVFRDGPEASAKLQGIDAPFDSLRCYVESRLEKPIKGGPIFGPVSDY
jgi:DNA repair protein RecO (recombination protein O)